MGYVRLSPYPPASLQMRREMERLLFNDDLYRYWRYHMEKKDNRPKFAVQYGMGPFLAEQLAWSPKIEGAKLFSSHGEALGFTEKRIELHRTLHGPTFAPWWPNLRIVRVYERETYIEKTVTEKVVKLEVMDP